jgi:glycosyltransferase involved in cell wall biosynthesis
MLLSFIIPAHNEANSITACLSAIHQSARTVGQTYEIIVVDDASTDHTATLAARHGARVISVTHRHIAATRNAGGRAAQGELFFFIDADTIITPHYLRSALDALSQGAVGGGGVPSFDRPLPLWFYLAGPVFFLLVYLLRQPGGSSLFCTKPAFQTCGGFDETYYAAEDALFVCALKKHGRFVLAKGHVLTSGRKIRGYTAWFYLKFLFSLLTGRFKGLRRREGLDLWYGPRRS